MQYAIVNGVRQEPSPGLAGYCPTCETEVIAKCGSINTWHWAHKSRFDCDTWSEGEGQWHLDWKKKFYRQWREKILGPHRADVKTPHGVIELQASSISAEMIAEREEFYREMVWVVDAREFIFEVRPKGNYCTFRWKHPRKSWWGAERPIYFDLGNALFKIEKLHDHIPCGGWGKYVSYESFTTQYSQPQRGHGLCEYCHDQWLKGHLIETDMHEYYTLDIDPGTIMCETCRERKSLARVPDDPSLWDCYTPLSLAGIHL